MMLSISGAKKHKNKMIFVIKVTTNKEDRALELISEKVRKKDSVILKDKLYWDDVYIKKYLDTYLKRKKKKK